jgi:predicted dehydrogenase
MNYTNRRNFLKTAFLGAGLSSIGMTSCLQDKNVKSDLSQGIKHKQRFNMCGYSAPAIDRVRVGFIGLGNRGPAAVQRISRIEGVEIAALGDKHADRVQKVQERIAKAGLPKAKEYAGSEDSWKAMCEDPDLDLIYICTPWSLHTPMAVYAMEHGKHAAVEVPAAKTLEEAWLLVETSERTRKHCMMLENCCYDFFELLTLNMARNGLFGEIIHAEGAYIHDLLENNFNKDAYSDMWRLRENQNNGNLYPTHGLGPICQVMNINRGDRMDFLTSVSSNDFQMAAMAAELAKEDPFYQEFVNKEYRGNMNTSTIRTVKGRTIMIQHDVTSARPYSRIHLISGTKGIAQKYPLPGRIALGHSWMTEEEIKALSDEYTPEIVKRVGEMAKKVGGHGGMDFMMDWRLIDCLRNGLPLDQDVYDAALWSVITPLSQWSIENRSNSIDVPDFTCGSWETNKPFDISLQQGGNTGVRDEKKEAGVQLEVG